MELADICSSDRQEQQTKSMGAAFSQICGFFIQIIDKIKDVVHWILDKWDGVWHYRISINTSDNQQLRSKRAIFAEIVESQAHLKLDTVEAIDCGSRPEFVVRCGSYVLLDPVLKEVNVDVTEKEIVLKVRKSTSTCPENPEDAELHLRDLLQKFYQKIHAKHNQSANVIQFFTSKSEGGWSYPTFRQTRNIFKMQLSDQMNAVLEDVAQFYDPGNKVMNYDEKGHAYRLGYLLHGPPGTGKSSMAEIIASVYGCGIYMFTLNANNLSDSSMISSILSVPPRSVIVFDEIDNQLETVKRNPTANVSVGGLFTAIDGPQRLANGCIVIFTSNSRYFLGSQKLHETFERPGRVDKVFCLQKNKPKEVKEVKKTIETKGSPIEETFEAVELLLDQCQYIEGVQKRCQMMYCRFLNLMESFPGNHEKQKSIQTYLEILKIIQNEWISPTLSQDLQNSLFHASSLVMNLLFFC